MAIRYYKLFDLLNRKGMKKSDLREILSPGTVAKLSKGEYISGEVVEKLCRFLNCQPGDIMEFFDRML
jgi:putative transcriptional regulator